MFSGWFNPRPNRYRNVWFEDNCPAEDMFDGTARWCKTQKGQGARYKTDITAPRKYQISKKIQVECFEQFESLRQ